MTCASSAAVMFRMFQPAIAGDLRPDPQMCGYFHRCILQRAGLPMRMETREVAGCMADSMSYPNMGALRRAGCVLVRSAPCRWRDPADGPRSEKSSPGSGNNDCTLLGKLRVPPSVEPRPMQLAAARSPAVPPSVLFGRPSAKAWPPRRAQDRQASPVHAAWPMAGGHAAAGPSPLLQRPPPNS